MRQDDARARQDGALYHLRPAGRGCCQTAGRGCQTAGRGCCQMPGEARFALLLHGRLGNVMMPPSESLRHSDAEVAAGGLHGLVRLLAASHLEHVVVPNEADVFLHSWNPGLGLLLDAQYGPSLQGSLHEPVNASLEKAASQALSIARCAQLASKRYAASMMHSHPECALTVLPLLLVAGRARVHGPTSSRL